MAGNLAIRRQVSRRTAITEFAGALEAMMSPDRLADARARLVDPRPSKITDRDRPRAKALSESVSETRRYLEEAS